MITLGYIGSVKKRRIQRWKRRISIGQTLVLATRKQITAMFLIIKMESGTMDSSQRIIQ